MNHPLTIIVDAAIIVLVTVLHEFLDVIFRDGLSSSLKHYLQLIQVDIAVSVSAGSVGQGRVSEPIVGTGEGKKQSYPQTREAGQGHWEMGPPTPPLHRMGD